jgi:hypothetical protein
MKILILSLSLAGHVCFGQFKSGYYFAKDETKINGLLKFQYNKSGLLTNKLDGDCTLAFKKEKGGKRVVLTTDDICCFVIEKDSFTVVRNFRLNSFAYYPRDFAKILVAGRINLYSYFSTVSQRGVPRTVKDWLIEKDGKTDKLTRKRFKELMPVYLNDYPELVSEIQNNSLRYKDTEKILKVYNAHSL